MLKARTRRSERCTWDDIGCDAGLKPRCLKLGGCGNGLHRCGLPEARLGWGHELCAAGQTQ